MDSTILAVVKNGVSNPRVTAACALAFVKYRFVFSTTLEENSLFQVLAVTESASNVLVNTLPVITLLVAGTPYALIYTRGESLKPEGGREEERYCIFTLLCRDL